MRIYGGHDYYDCVLGYGSDPSVVLVRKNEEIDPEKVSIPYPVNLELHDSRMYGGRFTVASSDLKHLRVIFCSKIYYGVEICSSGTYHYFWQADKLRAWEASQRGVEIKVHNRYWRDWKKKYTLEDYFAVVEAPADLRDFMITNRYAIILKKQRGNGQQAECWMNPHGLKKIGFAKAIDPYTAYQELSMWVGGVLAGESPQIVKIVSDKVLLEGHGFDNVFSFRGPRIR